MDEPKQEFEKLLEQSRELAENTKAENTKAAYASDFGIFVKWCSGHGLSALPSDAPTLSAYIAECRERELKVSTVTRYLSAISQAHKLAGHPSPTLDPRVREVAKGFRRVRGSAPRQVKPLLLEQLIRIVEQLGISIRGLRDSAILTIGFMAALRRSEISALEREHLESVPEGLILTLPHSKTDQEGLGRKIGIPFGNDRFCPVAVIRRWYTQAQIDSGPLFFGVYRGADQKIFLERRERRPLCDRQVAQIVKRSLELAGYDSAGYSGHSLRAGFCTSAGAAGIPEHAIMRHTGHRSERVMRGYIRDGELFTTNPLLALLDCAPPRAARALPEKAIVSAADDTPIHSDLERPANPPPAADWPEH